MRETATLDQASSALARRALLVTLCVGTVSSASGLLASTIGMVAMHEFIFIACVFLFTLGALLTLLVFRRVALQTIATATTSYYAAHMCVGVLISLFSSERHLNVFIYLLWFFPLLVFNQLVNQPAISRLLGRTLLAAPLVTILCLSPRWAVVLPPEQQVLLAIFCLTFVCFALTLNIVIRYREKYIVEQQRAESLKVTAEVFESISECFISLDAGFRLIYVNDAACAELDIDRRTALMGTLSQLAPRFCSNSILSGLEAASVRKVPTLFEARSEMDGTWFDLRCFPRLDGLSIYFRDITSRKNDEIRIQHLAFFDVLTGLPNRQSLCDRLTEALGRATSGKHVGALLYVDLDDFKTLNDTVGHELGDALLQQLALRLTSCLDRGIMIARIGGDEFGIILEALAEDSQSAMVAAMVVADSVLEIVCAQFSLCNFVAEIKASIGATLFGVSGAIGHDPAIVETVEDLLKRVDLAMYRAKAQGGNTKCFFDPAMQTEVLSRAALLADLRYAILQEQFTLYYQPQVDSRGVVTGAEALLRWIHPIRGAVAPSDFIPLAEEAGLIIDLGRWVLQTACLQLSSWSTARTMDGIAVAVNVSVHQLRDRNFVEDVKEALRSSGADPHRLKLEITESSIMEGVAEVIAKMVELRDLGITFSLDDFGTGYSSLSHLRYLPLDQLKIDRSFIADIVTDDKYASIARTIITLGRSLNLNIIAEGVETEAQRAVLIAEGCHLYQGYLYSPAVPIPKFEMFVAASTDFNVPKTQCSVYEITEPRRRTG